MNVWNNICVISLNSCTVNTKPRGFPVMISLLCPKNKKILGKVKLLKKEFLKSLKSMQNNNSAGNDGLSKKFYETFWNDIKNSFSSAVKKVYETKLSSSQIQAVIKLIEETSRDKRFIKLEIQN